jgi:hypothetical protein
LKRLPRSRVFLADFVVALILFLAPSCTVPLAPDYQILKQTFEVTFVSGASPQIQVHNVYTLQNSGTAPLNSIDLIFPDEKIYGRADLRVELDGRNFTPQSLPAEYQPGSPGALRLSFDAPWVQKSNRELTIDYRLASTDSSANFALASENFYLGLQGWLPIFVPPNHILSSAPIRPDKMDYSVRIPSGFVILARGRVAGRKQAATDTSYRFALGKDDLAPYVVAGHYASPATSAKSETAIFWTAQSPPSGTSLAELRFGSAWAILQKNFGQLAKRTSVPYIVESSALRDNGADSAPSAPAFAAFPGGVLINPSVLALGTNHRGFVNSVECNLAKTWFGDAMRPAPVAAIALGQGLPAYAAVVIDESIDGSDARKKDIAQLLNDYDQGRQQQANLAEKAAVATLPADTSDQRRLATAKSALLFIALEDTYGPAPVREGLAQATQILRGKAVTVNDVRAAIEFTTKANLAETFRVWLYNPGIPASFRARYGQAAENQK